MGDTNPLLTFATILSLIFTISVIVIGLQKSGDDFGHFGQGLFGIAGSIGFLVAAWLFYFQGTDKPRLKIDTMPTVVPLMPDAQGRGRVLLQLNNMITNNGGFPAKYDCVAVDVRGLKPADALPRHPVFRYDVNTSPLVIADSSNPQWAHCMTLERERWERRERKRLDKFRLPDSAALQFVTPDSGYRYDEFTLEAGESRTRDFEVVIPCDYAAVRVHFVVPKPANKSVTELKTVISLLDGCEKSLESAARRPARAG